MNPVDALLIGTVLGLAAAALGFLIWRSDVRLNAKREEILRRIRLDEKRADPAKHLTGSPRMAIVVDGPHEGMIHEIYGTFRPDVIAFPDDEIRAKFHFYRLDADGGLRYLRTEPRAV